ncbi:TRAP transporter small permease [Hominifimenecus sp. rT4P-3]|uniref:TRAP transporter small permease n=1 Tax=Hominifimenecus sp. rT4P-3 TaxID=3242979 RepID=UPI003DA699B4
MKVLKWLDAHFEEAISIAAMAVLSCVMMLQVIMRYMFGQALPWPEEFCRYAFIYSAFLGIGYCIRNKNLLKVTLISSFLPKKVVRVLDYFTGLLSIVFYALLFYASVQVTLNCYQKGQTSSATGWVMWIFYLAGPIGFACGIIRQLQELWKMFRHCDEKKEADL